MTVRELYKKYKKDYTMEIFGRPLDHPCIPFTLLPQDKDFYDCEVVEIKIVENEHTITGFSLKTMKPLKPYKVKGTVMAYVK